MATDTMNLSRKGLLRVLIAQNDALLAAIDRLQADVTEIKMRDEVPQEVADAIGALKANLANNFTPEN